MAVLRTIQIVSTPDVLSGKPRLEGRRISVAQIADLYAHQHWTVDKIAQSHDLTFAEVHAALSYYHDHRDELDRTIQQEHDWAHRQRVEQSGQLHEVMTTTEVARVYGITDHAVRDAIRNNRIQARKSAGTWLIRREDAEARWGEKKHSD